MAFGWRWRSGRPVAHVAGDLGMHPETLRKGVRQAEADSGARSDLPSSEEREEIKKLRKENFEPSSSSPSSNTSAAPRHPTLTPRLVRP